jgi:single-strand DNA-binding protein
MNKVTIMGRLTRDVELKTTPNGVSMARFTVAVDRPYAREGQQSADFISCVAWKHTAEFISKYFAKGRMIAIDGYLMTGSFTDRDGKVQYVTDVVVDKAHFCGDGGQR